MRRADGERDRGLLLLTRSEVEELLDLDELIDALVGAMSDLSAGLASVTNRVGARVDHRDGLLAAMPATPRRPGRWRASW